MSAVETREELHKLIEESDESIIRAVYALLKTYNDVLDTETDMDEYNRDIDEAMEEIKKGEFTTHEQAIKQLNK